MAPSDLGMANVLILALFSSMANEWRRRIPYRETGGEGKHHAIKGREIVDDYVFFLA